MTKALLALAFPALLVGAEPTIRGPDIPRAVHTATLLSTGDVLVAGGCTLHGCESDERAATTEVFDPPTRRWRAGPRLTRARVGHVAVRLRDGSVLLLGGWEGNRPTATAELYVNGRFVAVGSMETGRGAPTATTLRDGRVLVTGGTDGTRMVSSAEVYEPERRRFVATGSMTTARSAHAAALLPDGRVLVSGGSVGERVHRTAEVWSARTGRFRRVGPMTLARHKHAAVPVRGGVLVLGGSDALDFQGRYASAELFLPRTGRFVRTGRMSVPRFKLGDAALALPGGRALVAGGGPTADVYEPRSRRFKAISGTGRTLSFATATLLSDGSVLVVGGYDDRIAIAAGAWILTP